MNWKEKLDQIGGFAELNLLREDVIKVIETEVIEKLIEDAKCSEHPEQNQRGCMVCATYQFLKAKWLGREQV